MRRNDNLKGVIRWRLFRDLIEVKLGGATHFPESCRDQFTNFDNEEIGFGRGKEIYMSRPKRGGGRHRKLRLIQNRSGDGARGWRDDQVRGQARYNMFQIKEKEEPEIRKTKACREREREGQSAGGMKCPPNPFMIENIESDIAPAEPQREFEEKSAGHRPRYFRKSGGDFGPIPFAARTEFLAFAEPSFHDRADSVSRFSFAMKKPAVERYVTAKNHRLERRVETKDVLFGGIRHRI